MRYLLILLVVVLIGCTSNSDRLVKRWRGVYTHRQFVKDSTGLKNADTLYTRYDAWMEFAPDGMKYEDLYYPGTDSLYLTSHTSYQLKGDTIILGNPVFLKDKISIDFLTDHHLHLTAVPDTNTYYELFEFIPYRHKKKEVK